MLSKVHVPIVSDSGGVVTALAQLDSGRNAWLEGVYVAVGTLAATTDITFTDHETGVVLLTITNIAASAMYLPRYPACDAAGAAVAAQFSRPLVGPGGIDVAVAQAGNSHAGDLWIWLDDGAQS